MIAASSLVALQVDACTVLSDCSGHATSVVDNNGQCDCTCRHEWKGVACQTCPLGFNANQDCSECSAGYEGYPNCQRSCTPSGNCSGHALAVSGTWNMTGGECFCSCQNSWNGTDCSSCPTGWDISKDCALCSYGFAAPDCHPVCLPEDCNNHASSITGNPTTGCNCTCINAWHGDKCEICPFGVDKNEQCGACLPDYTKYPRCIRECTIASNCSNHANGVTGDTDTNCTCDCRGEWHGASCDQCPHGVDNTTLGDCSRCAYGFGGYPNCLPICTQDDCSGHAALVTGTPTSGCNCTCRNLWNGTTCDQCPPGIDSSSSGDCGRCISSYGPSYPDCRRGCSVAQDCVNSNQAFKATGYYPDCTCHCRDKYELGSNGTCYVCPMPFAVASSGRCNTCTSGYNGYPNCGKDCSILGNCTAGAATVTGNDLTTCTCVCKNEWYGDKCQYCPWNYDPAQDCNACAPGLVAGTQGSPYCAVPCTSAANCTGRGQHVTGDSVIGCQCNCTNQWIGSGCTVCPFTFLQGGDCNSCASGYEDYPHCSRTCTTSQDCSSHADGVVGNERDGCNCTCHGSWYGDRCQSCPPLVIPAASNCSACVTGSYGYPSCRRDCTSASDCLGHADNVTGIVNATHDTCQCNCSNMWYGDRCQSCPVAFDSSKDCGVCRSGYGWGYPQCEKICTNSANCYGRAETNGVQGLVGNCSCLCKNKWEGDKCQSCPAGYSSSANCGACLSTYSGYPNCSLKCTKAADCSNHATYVSGNMNDGCHCTCAHKWSSGNCSVCPESFNAAQNCAACAVNYTGYPDCTRPCHLDLDCAVGQAGAVTGDYFTGCNCACLHSWDGARCDVCPIGFNASTNCSSCADGYSGYPQCSPLCTVANDCTPGAAYASGTQRTGCWCHCKNRWYGQKCQFCPHRYNSSEDCATCSQWKNLPTFVHWPYCYASCADAVCGSNSDLVAFGNSSYGCFCRCRPDLPSGHSCITYLPPSVGGSCATGYTNYPNCVLNRNCTSNLDCNGNGVVLDPTQNVREGCTCNCSNSWTLDNCTFCPVQYDVDNNCHGCAPGYDGLYPSCHPKCDTLFNCTGHALEVSGNIVDGCNCNCTNAWVGAKCEICPWGFDIFTNCGSCLPGFEDYPNCYKKCTNNDNCTGNAYSVSGNTGPGGCNCNCRHQWTKESNCSFCPAQYNSTDPLDCGVCVDGWDGYPACGPKCTNDADCNGRASDVSGNNITTCTCTCRNEWGGDNCSTCNARINSTDDCGSCIDGYHGYPSCVRTCTELGDCTNHSNNVTGNGDVGCNCDCRNAWTGQKCDECSYQYNASLDCGHCADGYSGQFPACYANCNVSLACNDNAVNVSGNVGTGCNCTCRNAWTGASCAVCPAGITGTEGADCDACVQGYIGYPDCERVCTNDTDCSLHAASVEGTVSADFGDNCTCHCQNEWSGDDCAQCPTKFDPLRGCGACSPLYEGSYPDCKLKCTKVGNCNNHAAGVRGNIVDGCLCTCLNQWHGQECETCPALYNPHLQCGACIAGYSEYPTCFKDCTNLANCSGNAANVDGNERRGCFCVCKNKWEGATCDSCPVGYSVQSDCGDCANGYTGYPNCSRACSNANDCSGNAEKVEGSTFSGCNCTCRNAWQGDDCSVCPPGTNVAAQCGACNVGYIGYPNCQLKCTNAGNCSGHATPTGVVGTSETGCNCTCQNKWEGATCDVCPLGFNEANNCATCAAGFAGFPNCTRNCELSDCSNHATKVTGSTFTTCNCTCRNQWHGEKCEICDDIFSSTADCSTCAIGYYGYPDCVRDCNVFVDCDNHATTVTGIAPNCSCACRTQWTYDNCTLCPLPFGGYDCGGCTNGNSGYPNCAVSCTNLNNCTNHALIVSGNELTNCTCTCRNQWYGEKCDNCPPNFESAADCSGCASPLYEGVYPHCYLKCTNIDNCTGQAANVSGNIVEGCHCDCRHRWYGAQCDKCPWGFNSTEDCGSCIAGYSGYPNCSFTCTNAANCTGHADFVNGTEITGCDCNCSDQWYSGECDQCNPIYNQGTCDRCAAGRGDYPNCDPLCTIPSNCSGADHAYFVNGTVVTGCKCECSNAWFGGNCSQCPPFYDASQNCGACIDGYSGYPLCALTCTVPANCTGQATSVSGNTNTPGGCQCQCENAWSSNDCSVCPPTVNVSTNCSACIDTYNGYPACGFLKCTVPANCTNQAYDVTGDTNVGCTCNCTNHWEGQTCAFCPQKFDDSTGCDRCAPGYEDYPNCYVTCTSSADCNDHAATVTGNYHTGCTCQCRHQWDGAVCNLCPVRYSYSDDCAQCSPGYDTYPHCYETCTNAKDCTNQASSVSGNYGPNGCNCTCAARWTGPKCDICPPGFDASTGCHLCQTGHEKPGEDCPRTCDIAHNCTNNADSVTGNSKDGCVCNCINSWKQPDCSTCPARINASAACGACDAAYEFYANQCSYTKCTSNSDCHGHASSVTGNDHDGCTCHCKNAWEQSTNCGTCPQFVDSAQDCGACVAGRENYPLCNAVTCTVAANCTGPTFATSVLGNSLLGCNCTCLQGLDPVVGCSACLLGWIGTAPNCEPITPVPPTPVPPTPSPPTPMPASSSSASSSAAGSSSSPAPYAASSSSSVPPVVTPAPTTTSSSAASSSSPTSAPPSTPAPVATSASSAASSATAAPIAISSSTASSSSSLASSTPVPTTTHAPGTCTISDYCSGHASKAEEDPTTNVCTCTCTNSWSGDRCNMCDAKYNQSQDCGACADDRVNDYPKCNCQVHATGSVTISYPSSLAIDGATVDRANFVSALSKDLNALLVSSALRTSCNLGDTATGIQMSGFVFSLGAPAVKSSTIDTVKADLDVNAVDPKCPTCKKAAQCVGNYIKNNCMPLTNLKQVLPPRKDDFSCTGDSFAVVLASPCGATSCAAAQDSLLHTTPAPTPEEEGAPIAIIIGCIIGAIILLLIIGFAYKRLGAGKAKRAGHFEDRTDKNTKRFRLDSVAGEALTNGLATSATGAFGTEELELGRHQEDALFQGYGQSEEMTATGKQGFRHEDPEIDLDEDDDDLPPPPVPHQHAQRSRADTINLSPGPDESLLDHSTDPMLDHNAIVDDEVDLDDI